LDHHYRRTTLTDWQISTNFYLGLTITAPAPCCHLLLSTLQFGLLRHGKVAFLYIFPKLALTCQWE
jgi:hypothetical protein